MTTQPRGDTVCEGKPFTLTAAGSGTNVTYQWMKGAASIPGATSATYTVASATSTDAATYSLMITNSCGSVSTNNVDVVVNAPAKIVTDPTNVVIVAGQPITFTVTASGAAPLSYQWYNDNGAIPNATGASYTITSATLADSGSYHCVVSNNCGSDTSASAAARKPVSVTDIVTGGYLLGIATPNPTSDATAFNYALPTASTVRIALTDAMGRQVAMLVNGDVDAGLHRDEINGATLNLVPGVYMYTITAGAFNATQQVVVIK